jgi:cytochrome c
MLAVCAAPAAAADGAKLFALQCKSCHGEASTPAGPTLKGVFGAKVAGRADFNYSPALTKAGGAWDAATLDRYLAAPGKFAPGARMFASLAKPEDRTAVIAHLKTLK